MLYLKKIYLIILLVLLGFIGRAQTSYFGNVESNSGKLEMLKNTTTLFTLKYADYKDLQLYDEAIKKSWTISPYKIIKPEELSNYQTLKNYSFFYFDTYTEKIDTVNNLNVIYGLKLISPTQNPKQVYENTLATITLFTDYYTTFQMRNIENEFSKRSAKSRQLNYLYHESNFLNWSPGLLAGYLKRINDGLLNKQSQALDFQFYNKKRILELAEDVLYIPDYIREVFSAQPSTQQLQAPRVKPNHYKIKFVSNKTLDSLILSKNSSIKYLVYTQRSRDKIISIYDSKDMSLIYQKFSYQSPIFDILDLNNIKETIKSIQ